ncbi:MAG: hypothetical protein ACHQ1G_05295 [Planctomycetota bacterium]
MKNRMIALLGIAAALAAQEPESRDRVVVRVYDLGGLVGGMRSPFFPETQGDLAVRPFSLLGNSHQREAEREDLPSTEEGSPAQMVAELVRAFLGELEGGRIAEIGDGRSLLVTAREADHKTIVRVIEQLRAAGDPPVELDVRHLAVLDRSLDDATRAALLSPGRLSSDQIAALARLDARGGRRGGTLEVALGSWGVFRAVRELRYLPDFDVEIAQGAAIADPVPAIATDGLKAAVRPFLLRDGRLVLRIVASMGDREGEPRRVSLGALEADDQLRLRNTDFGEVEQVDYRGAAVSTEAVVAPGQTTAVVLASATGDDVRWDILAITVRAAPKPVVEDTFAIAPVGALVAEDPVRTVAWHGETGELALLPGEAHARLGMEGVLERIGFPAEEEGEFKQSSSQLHGGSLLLRGKAANLKTASEGIAALERGLIRPAQLEVRLVSERPGAEARTVGFLYVPLTVGRGAALAAYRRRDTVGDYDVEVAQEARIADPEHTVVTAGVFGNASLYANTDGTYRLHLDLTVVGAPDGIRTIESGVGGVPMLQSVELSTRASALRLDLAGGRARTVDLGSDPFSSGEDARLTAIVTVQPQ